MHRSLLSLAAVAALGTSTYAAPATWDWYYEATKTPGTSGSIEAPLGTLQSSFAVVYGAPAESLGSGTFTASTLVTPGAGSAGAYQYTTNNSLASLRSATGYTIEWNMKINTIDQDEAGNGSIALVVEDGDPSVNRWWVLGFDVVGGQYQAELQGASVSNKVTYAVDNTAFHTYRLTALGNVTTLYVDGVLAGSISDPRTDIAIDNLTMGDGTGLNDSSYTVDYLRVSDDGAFPIPEPATLSLVALGGLAMLRRRPQV